MKDLELKKILDNILNLQTKFLIEDDEVIVKGKKRKRKERLSPEEQEKRKQEIINSGNPNLDWHTLISCSNGQTYVSPKIEDVVANPKPTSDQWLSEQKKLESENKVNFFTACDYQARIMKNQNRLNPKKTQDDTFLDCLTLCYSIMTSIPDKCANTFKFKKSESETLTVTLGIGSWWGSEYYKYLKDNTYKTKDPWEVISKRNYSYWDGSTYATFNFSTIDKNDTLMHKSPYGNNNTEMNLFLPLTNSEKNVIDENPFTDQGEYKGKGTQICKKPNVGKVNLRTTAGVNNDTGTFDPFDNYITWVTKDHLGTFLFKKFMWRGDITEGGETTKRIRKLLKEYFSNKAQLALIFGIPLEEAKELYPYQLENLFLTYTPLNFSKYPKDFQDKIVSNKIGEYWYKIKTSESFSDVSDPGLQKYDEVWVSTQTTEVCQISDPKKSQTSYDIELLRRAPIKPLKVPNEEKEAGFKGEGPRLYNQDGYGF